MSKKVLLAGESWMSYTTHVKGFDAFYTSTYETGEKWLKAALEAGGYEVTFLPNHLANEEFPFSTRGTPAEDKQFTFRVAPSTIFVFKELVTLNSVIGILLILLAVGMVVFRKQKS